MDKRMLKKVIEAVSMDLETGGLNDKTDGICSIGLYVNDELKDEFYLKPNPKLRYSPKSLTISNITLEEMEEKGITEAEAVTRVKKFFLENTKVVKGKDDKPTLLGQNIYFDIGFVRELFFRNNSVKDFSEYYFYRVIDVMHWKNFLKLTSIYSGPIKLEESFSFITGKTHVAHTALEDARAAKQETGAILKAAQEGKWNEKISWI